MPAIVRPLVSVARVRVSLTVRTKQLTRAGDCARCCSTDMRGLLPMLRAAAAGLFSALALFSVSSAQAPIPEALDKIATQWVDATFKKMSLDDKIGQLVVSSFNSTYLSSDSEIYEALTQKV